MKTMSLFRGLTRVLFFVVGSLLLTGSNILAQTSSNTVPVVTIEATTPIASWSGAPGVFTVFRAGDPTIMLNVYCVVTGTASNGVDYQTIGNWVQLPSGVLSNTIVVNPINRGQTGTETVTVTLSPSPLLNPVNYIIGNPNSATVDITPASVTNNPPAVALTEPPNGAIYTAPATIELIAEGSDVNGFVTSVEFFNGSNSLGVVSNFAIVDPPGPKSGFVPGTRAFFLTWSNVPAGPLIVVTNPPPPFAPPGQTAVIVTNVAPYILTAKATANNGLSTVSAPVSIIVEPGPPTNIPPVVRITSPPEHAVFRAPVTVPIFAYALDPGGLVTAVEFFDGSKLLGVGSPIGPIPLPVMPIAYTTPVSPAAVAYPPISIVTPTNLFVYVWSNAPVGGHVLTALATDNHGGASVSPPVDITILPPVPPLTNRPDIVSIEATDPVAIAGTNCWPWLGLVDAPPTWSNWTASAAILRTFTNCGPKDAIFTVHRWGETNDNLDVTYAIGGTASNGVDYLALPGTVTIAAGERSAQITVVPTGVASPRAISTVILGLMRDTNVPPDYVVGIPPKAEAIILNGDHPWPTTAALADQTFHLNATGPDGAWFHIECSSDLVNWTALCTNQVVGGSIDFLDPEASANAVRYYRAVPEFGPPLQ